MRILIVEDERKVASFLARGLSEEGHATTVAVDGPGALAAAEGQPFDAVILDVMLPGMNGLAVSQALRERQPRIGILMLSALGELDHRVEGFAAGADDYLTKPFAFEELLMRLRALERRLSAPGLAAGALGLDPIKLVVTYGAAEVQVTPREASLLAAFLARPNETLSRDWLAAEAWDTPFDPGTNHVDVYINYLRKKLTAVGAGKALQTVRGEGYRLELP